MPHFRVDDNFNQSEEVAAIPVRHRNAALGLWMRCGAWSANQLTDGRVPAYILRQFNATEALIGCLVDAGLWQRSKEYIQFNNWVRWQRDRESVKAFQERNRDRKRSQRDRDRNSPIIRPEFANNSSKPRPSLDHDPPPQVSEPCHAVTLLPEPITNSGYLGGDTAVGSRPTSPPPKFCSLHDPDGTDAPCAACGERRRAHDAWTAKQTQDRKRETQAAARETQAARLRAIDDCDQCDADGYLPNGRVCDHVDRTPTARKGRAAVDQTMGWT